MSNPDDGSVEHFCSFCLAEVLVPCKNEGEAADCLLNDSDSGDMGFDHFDDDWP